MQHSYPVGRAQWQVCKALGHPEIETFQEAEDLFKRLGITVISVRQGRQSVPSITIKSGSAWNVGGDADTWEACSLSKEQVDAIKPWMVQR